MIMTVTQVSEEETLGALAREIRGQAAEGQERLSLERLLHISHWGRRQMERLFRERFLTSPVRYFRDCQWDNAERLLQVRRERAGGGCRVRDLPAREGCTRPSSSGGG